MDRDGVQACCGALPEAALTFPFGEETGVWKVRGKMFALVPLESAEHSVSLKVDPARAEALREEHAAITPGYHLNKKHWITVVLDGSVPHDLVDELVEDSYDLVVDTLPRAKRPPARRSS